MKTYSYVEALRISKDTGQQFMSRNGRRVFVVQYITRLKGWEYHLTFTELMARYRPATAEEIDIAIGD